MLNKQTVSRPILISPTLWTLAVTGLAPFSQLGAAENQDVITITASETAVAPTDPSFAESRHDLDRTPGGATLIDARSFSERQVMNIADALRYVPGVWASSATGTDSTFISIRGSNLDDKTFDLNGIKVLQDGLPITAADGNTQTQLINPLTTDRLLVYRGANAVAYGASTLGGSIELISPTAQSTPSSALLRIGSHETIQAQATASHVFNETFDALASIDVGTYGGYREHSEQDTLRFYGNAGWQISDNFATRLYISFLNLDMQIPGSLTAAEVAENPDQANANAIAGNYQRNLDVLRLANKSTWHIKDGERLDIGFVYETQELFHPIVNSSFFFGGLHVERDRDDIHGSLRYRKQWTDHELTIGLNGGYAFIEGTNSDNNAGSPGDVNTIIDNEANNIEAYALDRWPIHDDWTLIVALQVATGDREVKETSTASNMTTRRQDTYTGFNPRIGVLYHVSDTVDVFGHVSRLFEPPTLSQLEDEGSGGTLEAMSGTTFEVGTRGTTGTSDTRSLSWDLVAYYSLIDDEILSVEDPAAPGTAITGNADSTIHAGLELTLNGFWALAADHSLEPALNMTWNSFTFDDDSLYGSNDLPGVPETMTRFELIYRHTSGWYGGPTLDLIGSRYADFTNSYSIDSYTLVGLRGGWSNDRWASFVEVRNLFDEEYIAGSSIRDDAAPNDAILNPGEPLSIYAGTKVSF